MTDSTRTGTDDEDIPRTRGGWIPVGTSAARREARSERATPRGDLTREKLIAAARQVFERDGYVDVPVADIAREAKVAHGTFYTYFSSKREVFIEIMVTIGSELTTAVVTPFEDLTLDPRVVIEESHRHYLEYYRENSAILALIDQLASIDSEIARQSRGGRRRHIRRVDQVIRRWQEAGLADKDIDPETTAAALMSMRSNFAFWWLGGGERYDPDQALRTLTDIWVRALGLPQASLETSTRSANRH